MIHDLADIAPRPTSRRLSPTGTKGRGKGNRGIFRGGDARPSPTGMATARTVEGDSNTRPARFELATLSLRRRALYPLSYGRLGRFGLRADERSLSLYRALIATVAPMDLSLFFAGTGGSVPSPRRGLPAILLRRGGDRLLFDCGEGTQRQLMRSVGLTDVGCVFITHFHADHWLGLPGMLKSFALREREQPLAIYGPPGLGRMMEQTRFIYGRLPYEMRVTELEAGDDVAFDGYAVAPIRVSHRANSAYGYAILEDSLSRPSRPRSSPSGSASRRGQTSAGSHVGRPSPG